MDVNRISLRFDEIKPELYNGIDGVEIKVIDGDDLGPYFVHVRMLPGSEFTDSAHTEDEGRLYVLRGYATVTVGHITEVCGPGTVCVIFLGHSYGFRPTYPDEIVELLVIFRYVPDDMRGD